MSSPFDAFLQYEAKKGLPQAFLRKVNATNPDTNAWALLERNEVSPRDFNDLFMAESTALGHPVPGSDVLALLAGEIRPVPHGEERLREAAKHGFKTAIIPKANLPRREEPIEGLNIIAVQRVSELIDAAITL